MLILIFSCVSAKIPISHCVFAYFLTFSLLKNDRLSVTHKMKRAKTFLNSDHKVLFFFFLLLTVSCQALLSLAFRANDICACTVPPTPNCKHLCVAVAGEAGGGSDKVKREAVMC